MNYSQIYLTLVTPNTSDGYGLFYQNRIWLTRVIAGSPPIYTDEDINEGKITGLRHTCNKSSFIPFFSSLGQRMLALYREQERKNHQYINNRKIRTKKIDEFTNDNDVIDEYIILCNGLRTFDLADDFLCIPQHLKARLKNIETGKWKWHSIYDLRAQILEIHWKHEKRINAKLWTRVLGLGKKSKESRFKKELTAVFSRDSCVGFGMQIYEKDGQVLVHSLICRDGTRISSCHFYEGDMGPAGNAGVRPGDVILGVNETAFLRLRVPKVKILREERRKKDSTVGTTFQDSISKTLFGVVEIIKDAGDPIALHVRRFILDHICVPSFVEPEGKKYVCQDTGEYSFVLSDTEDFHPLAKVLSEWGLLHSHNEEISDTRSIRMFQVREKHSLLASTMKIYNDTVSMHQHSYNYKEQDDHSSFIRKYQEEKKNVYIRSHIPTLHVLFPYVSNACRALSVRILNTFLNKDNVAYTIWVYDVELEEEWYAPVRYLDDFRDLHFATVCNGGDKYIYSIRSSIQSNFMTGIDSEEARCEELEIFLRELCGMMYKENYLYPHMEKVSMHLYNFLGSDRNGDKSFILSYDKKHQVREANDYYCGNLYEIPTNEQISVVDEQRHTQDISWKELKRSVQLYAYRAFLIPTLDNLVSCFISMFRSREVKNNQREILEQKRHIAIKDKVLEDLVTINSFISQVQNLLFCGCKKDLDSIFETGNFNILRRKMNSSNNAYKDVVFREAIREQVEIETYVPLRSIISRSLVHGWIHDDMEVQAKIKYLKNRPQSFFKIDSAQQSPSNWKTVSEIITKEVGLSALPCNKLQAIANAAKEIMRLRKEEHANTRRKNIKYMDVKETDNDFLLLGADDLLPIFIFCIVRSDIDRPCALCILLLNLCDPSKKTGEIGYYLTSFEAAVMHIRDFELSKNE